MDPNKDGKETEDQEQDSEGVDTETPEDDPDSSSDQDEEGEEDDSEDDSEDGDEEDDEDIEEADEDASDEEDDQASYFMNPNTIPKELKPAFNRMQASFTRRMQTLSLVADKAAAFDKLAKDPDFLQWLEAKRGGKNSQDNGEPGSKKSSDKGKKGGLSLEDVRTVIKEEVGRFEEARSTEQAKKQAKKEFAVFKKKNPHWVNYRVEIRELMRANPSLSLEQALRLASYDDATKIRSKKNIDRKKKANVSRPGGKHIKKVEKKKGHAKTIEEAFAMAQQELLEGSDDEE